MHPWLANTLRILLIAAIPASIVLTNVRLVLLPWYPSLEYGKPSFPPDPYGFTNTERKQHAGLALEFLVSDVGIEFLAEQVLPDGNRLYNKRELRHMQDVKAVTRIALRVWRSALVLTLCASLALAWRPGTQMLLRSGLMVGSAIVVVVLLTALGYILLNFNSFFTHFHQVLFESGTWTFLYSDTLIRLFPIKFWADVFILVSGMSLLEGSLLWWAAWRYPR